MIATAVSNFMHRMHNFWAHTGTIGGKGVTYAVYFC